MDLLVSDSQNKGIDLIIQQNYLNFLATHGKSHSSISDFDTRLGIFAENFKTV